MSEPMKYRKKPVVIEAMQMANERSDWTDDEADEMDARHAEIAQWIEAGGGAVEDWGVNFLAIETLEGVMHADLGDWIIRGIKGEFYPCKPDIFEATYDAVDEETTDA